MFFAKFHVGLLALCFLFVKALCEVGQPCNSTSTLTKPCDRTEVCDESTQKCQCAIDYKNAGGTCVSSQIETTPNYSSLVDNQGDGSLVAGILIPLFLIVFVICSIYVGKRFEVVAWFRARFNQRNRNYDEFMIGQDDDDPPLA